MHHQLLQLTESEVIFAYLCDPNFAKDIDLHLRPVEGVGFRREDQWATVDIAWNFCPAGQVAGSIELPVSAEILPYDEWIFCFVLPPGAAIRISTKSADGDWEVLGEDVEGFPSRQEITRPAPAGGADALRIEFLGRESTAKIVQLVWFGARIRQLAEDVAKHKVRWHPAWSGLIRPESEWGDLPFRQELLFDHVQLDGLRKKKVLPFWREHFALLEAAAQRAMQRQPEEELWISDYAPTNDERYVRTSERGRMPLNWDALRLAFVGIVNEDQAMIRHALRFLMSMLHLKSWTVSAEARVTGSIWDQRCFNEEMHVTSVALLMDWLDGALTERARELGHGMLWDRGLAVIERDVAKFEYVHHINQGPWFCRARILGGLLLEKEWPRFDGGYVERALAHQREGMDRYLLPDGGMDEGPMYLLLTLETVLPSLIAFARSRKCDVKNLLPAALSGTPHYLSALSQSVPGRMVPDSDCVSEHLNSDTCPILAGLFPGTIFEKLVADSLLSDRPYTYSQHYGGTGIFAFIFGPDQVEPPSPTPATFSLLPKTGIAASYRQCGADSLRLVFVGCKALPSHAHHDKGGFSAEVDGEPLFMDRGSMRYDDPRQFLLKRTESHCVLAPSFDSLTTVNQALSPVALIPDAQGDKDSFRASIDLTPVWPGSMLNCRRTLVTDTIDGWTVRDEGELVKEGSVVFYLQSRRPFQGSGGRWISGKIRVSAPWAERADTAEYLIDCEHRPIFRLRIWSGLLTSFDILTEFSREGSAA